MNELSAAKFILGPAPRVLFVHHQNMVSLHQAQETISALFRSPKIDIVHNTTEALTSVNKERYDLIFIENDLVQEESAGMIARALQTKKVATPLVGFCDHISETVKEACFAAGMTDVVVSNKLEAFLRNHVMQSNNANPRQLILNSMPRILIIDDLPKDFKIITASSLIMHLFPEAELEIVETSEAAIENSKANPYDLILIDFNVGTRIVNDTEESVYGDMVARDLQLAGVTTYLVGFSTDMADNAKRQRCLDAGMDDAIVPNDLCRFLETHTNDVSLG